jgi:hypothetical protein
MRDGKGKAQRIRRTLRFMKNSFANFVPGAMPKENLTLRMLCRAAIRCCRFRKVSVGLETRPTNSIAADAARCPSGWKPDLQMLCRAAIRCRKACRAAIRCRRCREASVGLETRPTNSIAADAARYPSGWKPDLQMPCRAAIHCRRCRKVPVGLETRPTNPM